MRLETGDSCSGTSRLQAVIGEEQETVLEEWEKDHGSERLHRSDSIFWG